MKFVITSTYSNVDQAWLDWYMNRLRQQEVIPGCTTLVDQIIETGKAEFTSKDPTSESVATTTYEIIK